MKRAVRWLMLAAVVASGPSTAAAAPGVRLPSDPLAGRLVFRAKKCNVCHAIWGEGGRLGPDLGKKAGWHTAFQLAGVLWNHSPQMIERMRAQHVPRPRITPEEMADLSAFLYFLVYFDEPGNPAVGAGLFAGKGCNRCHALRPGEKPSIGPPLGRYARYSSALFLARAMWSHGPKMRARMAKLGVKFPHFKGHELADIFAYVRSMAPAPESERVAMVPGSPARGEVVFVKKGCRRCHSVNGKGGTIGPDLARQGLHRSVTEIAGRMWNHGPKMWERMESFGIPVPTFTDDEIADLIAYLHFLSYFDRPGDPEKGAEVFTAKGCELCHAVGKGGGGVGPDLARSHAFDSAVTVAAAFWNHAPAMEEAIRTRGLPWPRFSADEVRDLVAYVRKAARAAAGKAKAAEKQAASTGE